MKALSIRQPWAWFIVQGFKNIENRDWSTKVRGPVLIHASKWYNHDEMLDDLEFIVATMKQQPGYVPTGERITLRMLREQSGGIVGQATITDCVTSSASPWFFGQYGFVLGAQKALPFRPLKGMLGFFEVPTDGA